VVTGRNGQGKTSLLEAIYLSGPRTLSHAQVGRAGSIGRADRSALRPKSRAQLTQTSAWSSTG
jgi:recombinational DNA repair ATPase RecF